MKEFWLEFECSDKKDLDAINRAIFDFSGDILDCFESLDDLMQARKQKIVKFKKGMCCVCFESV